MKIFVTGGAGFIGSALIRYIIKNTDFLVVNIDKLTYAGNLESLENVSKNHRYHFEQVDICNQPAITALFERFQPDGIIHLAAESHVDRSIDSSNDFIQTNIIGTHVLLEVSRHYCQEFKDKQSTPFRFHHVSTDEVFGSLGTTGYFTETTPYQPNSPYSASKAASDHVVRAWGETYGLPVITSNCSNNYGPYQFPEKLIPLMILNALEGKKLPVYGKGENIRDWLFVNDHAEALLTIFLKGKLQETYNIGGKNEKTNLSVVEMICDLLDELKPNPAIKSRRALIQFVKDRPGHDLRYAIQPAKIEKDLAWQPKESFATGLKKTVQWYIDNQNGWCKRVQDGSYQRQRLGLAHGS